MTLDHLVAELVWRAWLASEPPRDTGAALALFDRVEMLRGQRLQAEVDARMREWEPRLRRWDGEERREGFDG